MDWSIREVAKVAGTTPRALRHYEQLGLLTPARSSGNGYRRYDAASLLRLQRILLLRQLGLGLPQIAEVLAADTSEEQALIGHLAWLRDDQARRSRQIAAVERTIEALRGGEQLMAEKMFDGFDHTQYREEVTERWGADAYQRSDSWWRALSADEKAAWRQRSDELTGDWVAVARSGATPHSEAAQAVAERHVAWLTAVPGTPASEPGGNVAAYVRGLGEMYAADPRFGRNYAIDAGSAGAEFVRDALRVWADARS